MTVRAASRAAWRALAAALSLAGVAMAAEPARSAPAAPERHILAVAAPGLAPAPLRVRVWLPPGYATDVHRRYPTLYVNDGQDMEAVGLARTLGELFARDAITPVVVVAIDMPPDRMAAYGLSDAAAHRALVAPTRYGPVGADADRYSDWLVHTLVPLVDARFRTRPRASSRAVLGWSLGALNAFSLGWNYPEVFSRVGAFSPSFWLSADRSDAAAVQQTRLAQGLVAAGPRRDGVAFYFAVGDAEETDDRDGDGINDAVDDVADLVQGSAEGSAAPIPGLAQLGYHAVRLPDGAGPTAGTTARADVVWTVVRGGEHNQASWARMLPGFLRWAYGACAAAPAKR